MALNEADQQRGLRVRTVRKARNEDQQTFAESLRDALKGVIPTKYDRAVVSKMEKGSRRVTFEEIEAIVRLDPEHRSQGWLAFGQSPTPMQKGEDPAESERSALGIRAGRRLQGRRPPLQTPKDVPQTKRGNKA